MNLCKKFFGFWQNANFLWFFKNCKILFFLWSTRPADDSTDGLMIVPRDKVCDICSGTHETHNTSLSGISIENPPDSIPHQRINRFKQVFAMDEYLSGSWNERWEQDESTCS